MSMAGQHVRVAGKLEGADELMRELQECGLNARKTVSAAAKSGAKVIADDGNRRAKALRGGKGRIVSARVTRRTQDHVTAAAGVTKSKWYYRFFETGAVPHEIQGRPLLRFYSRGTLIETPRVRHPGMAARPFLRPAFDAQQNEARDTFGETLRAAIEEKKRAMEPGDD